jgi:hypothetical protein
VPKVGYSTTSKQNQKRGGKTNKQKNGIHPLWIRSGAESVGVTLLLRVSPFVLMASKSEVLRRASTSAEYFSMFTDLPQQLACVFFPPAFFFSYFHPAQLFFPSFHLGGFTVLGVERYTISIIRSIAPCRSLMQHSLSKSPRIKYAGRN